MFMRPEATTAELYAQFVIPTYARFPLALVRGEGVRVWDEDDRAYLDFTSGIAVNSLGHAHPALRFGRRLCGTDCVRREASPSPRAPCLREGRAHARARHLIVAAGRTLCRR